MNSLQFNFNLDFTSLCKLPGLLHVYCTDKENKLLGANELQLNVIKEMYGAEKNEDLIGISIENLFSRVKSNAVSIACNENEQILKSELPMQFNNVWTVTNVWEIKMLTIKMPFYDTNGKLAGVIGISQYINKISLSKLLDFGLTKRQIECLFHLVEGKTAREIAYLLNISRRTVEHYIECIKDKLNCRTKSELICKAIATGFKEEYQ